MAIYNSSESRQYRYQKLLKENIIKEEYSEKIRFESLFFRGIANFYTNFMQNLERFHSRDKIKEIIEINFDNYLKNDNLSQGRFSPNIPPSIL